MKLTTDAVVFHVSDQMESCMRCGARWEDRETNCGVCIRVLGALDGWVDTRDYATAVRNDRRQEGLRHATMLSVDDVRYSFCGHAVTTARVAGDPRERRVCG